MDDDYNYFDRNSATLSADDPLRAWAEQNIDPTTGKLIATGDPQEAINRMIKAGIAPPPTGSALGYTNPMGDVSPGPEAEAPIRMYPKETEEWRKSFIAPQEGPNKGKSIPFAQGQDKSFEIAGSGLDPEVNPSPQSGIPLPRSRPSEAGPSSTDLSAQKKPSVGDAFGDFSKSLAGVKPVQPPPVNPVGTPSVRSPSAMAAPNLANILSLIGQGNAPTLSTLGRLLVAGKA